MKQPPLPLDGLDQAELVKMARDGDREAFGKLMVRWERYIKKTLRRFFFNQDDIDDAYQETVLSLMLSIQSMKHDNFEGWIRIAIRYRRHTFQQRVVNRARRLKTEETSDGKVIHFLNSCETSPFRVAEQRETQNNVKKAIDSLPLVQRNAVRGVYLEGKTCQEVANEHCVTRSAISDRIQRAKKALKGILSEYQDPLA